jgi:hypothetical protein
MSVIRKRHTNRKKSKEKSSVDVLLTQQANFNQDVFALVTYNQSNKFTYIDWRESFAGNIQGGDIYYDLAKLYGGCIIPYNKVKDSSYIKIIEGSSNINYSYQVSEQLNQFKLEYEKWIIQNGYDLNKIKFITGLIFLNMSPLHDDIFAKMLWFKSIELFHNVDKQRH